MKTLLKTWSELYRAFARCAALVATAEENLCCEELSSKILCSVEDEVLSVSFLLILTSLSFSYSIFVLTLYRLVLKFSLHQSMNLG